MRKWMLIAPVILASAGATSAPPRSIQPPGNRLLAPELVTWSRMKATDFGCMLEQRFGVQDKRFGCAADFDRIDWGDACQGDGNYNVGPELPSRVAKTLPAPIKAVDIEWEHGQIQSLFVRFDRSMSEREVESLLGVRLDGPRPDNVMTIGVQECSEGLPCPTTLGIIGFDHMGGADLECDQASPAEAAVPKS